MKSSCDAKKGILYIVGTGPGAAELMTVKAVRTLESCPVIFYPATKKGMVEQSRALETVRGAVNLEAKQLVPVLFSMKKNDEASYEAAKERCVQFLNRGSDCAFVTVGDPAVFSTAGKFSLLVEAEGLEVRFVAGLPSFCQAAAVTRSLLCSESGDAHVISGDDWFLGGRLRDELCTGGTKILMKMAKTLSKILLLVVELGIQEKCVLVQNASLEGERVVCGKDFAALAARIESGDADEVKKSYFSVLICML